MRRNWETDPLLCLKFSIWAGLKHLIDLNIAWASFRACFPAGTNRLAPAYRNAHGSPPFLISFCTGLKVDGAIFITWQCYRWLSANFDMQLGHVWIWAMFVYWSRGLFLWMVQRKSRFRNLKRVHGTTQEFASGTFRSVNSKAAYWPNTSSQ